MQVKVSSNQDNVAAMIKMLEAGFSIQSDKNGVVVARRYDKYRMKVRILPGQVVLEPKGALPTTLKMLEFLRTPFDELVLALN